MSIASSSTQRREYLFKIIVVGDISTGKTSLIQRYVRNTVNPLYKPTIGVDFATKLVNYEDTFCAHPVLGYSRT
ncbi:Ras-related protein Rab [Aphelenchoides bicaudatus]|nr:Ras-related protein Rab [Aphelenchoides bicaudatus]